MKLEIDLITGNLGVDLLAFRGMPRELAVTSRFT
jgi:hypothetical protein